MYEKFERIYNEYKDALFSYAYKVLRNRDDALDIVQEVFVRLWRNIEGLDESKVRFWLFRVCHNLIVDSFRKRKSSTDIDSISESYGKDFKETNLIVEKLLEKLPLNYREVVVLKYLYGYTYKEIACILGTNENTVKTWIRRAKLSMLKLMKSSG